ncbi:hypothetical protein Aca07nite_65490 [Actinoplanes capillaceus]|uniref:Pectinacetylesterase n=2 Tax=Actinoplanes campanulatus TaxID=113559 RepID=A0ABQ3WSW7_9ACTN|nr:hypothetical protein Aca07nite_65490 [Actinoplanes capillaceus]
MLPAMRIPRFVAALAAALLALPTAACTFEDTSQTMEWTKVVPAGDCHCADGSRFAFWERRADTARVVVFLNGAGVCWDATMCEFTGDRGESDFYDWSISGVEPSNREGMFDLTHDGNPFAGHSFLYVSSCTGDAHLGDRTQEYAPGLTVEHRGLTNGTAAMDYLAANYPGAEQVILIGKTAGSVAAPYYGGLIADRLPKAKVTVFGAQSGAWPGNADFSARILRDRWGVGPVPAAGVPGFWIEAGKRHPELVLSRFDFAYDPSAAVELTPWASGSLLETIDRNEAAIEAAGVTLHSYTAPGADHGLFEFEKFYEIEVNGVRFVDWLGELVTEGPPADVHCSECGP